jgi:hypothetical protein
MCMHLLVNAQYCSLSVCKLHFVWPSHDLVIPMLCHDNRSCHEGGLLVQAMQRAAGDLVAGPWAGGGVRDVYADYNALTLQVVTDALFGADLPETASREVTGNLAAF